MQLHYIIFISVKSYFSDFKISKYFRPKIQFSKNWMHLTTKNLNFRRPFAFFKLEVSCPSKKYTYVFWRINDIANYLILCILYFQFAPILFKRFAYCLKWVRVKESSLLVYPPPPPCDNLELVKYFFSHFLQACSRPRGAQIEKLMSNSCLETVKTPDRKYPKNEGNKLATPKLGFCREYDILIQ